MGCTTSEPIKEESEIKTVNIVKRKEESKEKIQNVESKYKKRNTEKIKSYDRYTGIVTIDKFPKYGIRSLLSNINDI